jgi:hypothetical protein
MVVVDKKGVIGCNIYDFRLSDSLDASVIDVCLNVFPWTSFRFEKNQKAYKI